jgi:hypothetical protein
MDADSAVLGGVSVGLFDLLETKAPEGFFGCEDCHLCVDRVEILRCYSRLLIARLFVSVRRGCGI